MIKKIEVFKAICDKCSGTIEFEDGAEIHFDNVTDATEQMRIHEWLITRDSHYCDECKTKIN